MTRFTHNMEKNSLTYQYYNYIKLYLNSYFMYYFQLSNYCSMFRDDFRKQVKGLSRTLLQHEVLLIDNIEVREDTHICFFAVFVVEPLRFGSPSP